mmetsp:Transcript_1357/g.4259  ORF Transcript_1357/g.4259 Transcript_1357/m.4259 type:complete len:543 (-) Transcript_1357:811-2439(-)
MLILFMFPLLTLSQSLNNRSASCNQELITSGNAARYFCSPLFGTLASSLGLPLDLGPCTPTCTALACTLASMGCSEVAAIQEERRQAGCGDGVCGAALTLDQQQCADWSRLLLPVPPGGFSFGAVVDFSSDWWATQLAVCNDDTAVDLAAGLVDLGPVQPALDWLADKQGECSAYCREPLCGIALLGCSSNAAIIEGELASRGPTCDTDLQCIGYLTPPPTTPACSSVTCQPVPNCPTEAEPWLQPSRVDNPTTDYERCCPTECVDPCVDAPCRATEPTAESCAAATPADVPAYFVVRDAPTACCRSCFDPCVETTCEPVGTCEAPLVAYRPATDCCIGCFPPCATVTCEPVDANACRAAGSTFIAGCTGDQCDDSAKCCDQCRSSADATEADAEGLDDDDMLLIVVGGIGACLLYSCCALCLFLSTRYVRSRSAASPASRRRSRAGSMAPGRTRRSTREAFATRGGGTVQRRPVHAAPPPGAVHGQRVRGASGATLQEETGFYQPVPTGPQSMATTTTATTTTRPAVPPTSSYQDVGQYFD